MGEGQRTLRRSRSLRVAGGVDGPGVNSTAPRTGVRRTPSPMILLHVAAAALYALTVGALWPTPVDASRGQYDSAVARHVGTLAAAGCAPAARVGRRAGHRHRARARFLARSMRYRSSVRSWPSSHGRPVCCARCPRSARSSCRSPRPRCCCRPCCRAFPGVFANPHRFAYGGRVARGAARRASRSSPMRCSSSPRCSRSS